ncbi:copper amine oxidase N-terminal domain-containing protein [Anaeromicrobium sediminis]|uniref:Copper amine oxidase-like N-terminal domain-containing protein n=1 Tax=Anaeromicrobium sediminis TaxID=1478221 RepID=A0A267MQZ4_9FIRM|nr:copper amine oxidase N-terminal domain-containing protein [Anaeromicrobium sediminis]PAB61150.1 hypothetical protein CCE28_01625 [Anaeromicrobium sediminis]
MRRKIIFLVVTMLMLASFQLTGFANEATDINDGIAIIVNGEAFFLEGGFVVENEMTLAPAAEIFTLLKMDDAYWNEDLQEITATKNKKIIRMFIESDKAYIDGGQFDLGVTPKIIDSTIYVPVKFICEAVYAEVYWSEEDQAVIITYEEKQNSISLPTIELESKKPEKMENQMLPDVAYLDINVSPEDTKKAEIKAQISQVENEISNVKIGIENLKNHIADGRDNLKGLLDIDEETLRKLEEKKTKLEEELKKYE